MQRAPEKSCLFDPWIVWIVGGRRVSFWLKLTPKSGTVGIFRSGVTQSLCVHLGLVSLHVGCALSAEWDTNNAGAGPRWREDTCFEPGSQTAALGPKSIGSILTAEVQKSKVLTKVSTFMKLCEAWVDCRSYGACC